MCVFIHAHLHMCIHMCICIVEKAGILEPGQSGGRQGRSTDTNLTKLEWVTREASSIDMYNNDVGKGVVYAYEAYEAK